MALFPQSTAKILAAFGVAALSLSAPAAMAQENEASVQSESRYQTMSQAEAETYGAGKIILHIGEGFPQSVARVAKENLIEEGYDVDILLGGPEDMLRLIIDGQSGRKHFDVGNVAAHLERVVNQVANPSLRNNFQTEPASP